MGSHSALVLWTNNEYKLEKLQYLLPHPPPTSSQNLGGMPECTTALKGSSHVALHVLVHAHVHGLQLFVCLFYLLFNNTGRPNSVDSTDLPWVPGQTIPLSTDVAGFCVAIWHGI